MTRGEILVHLRAELDLQNDWVKSFPKKYKWWNIDSVKHEIAVFEAQIAQEKRIRIQQLNHEE